MSTEFRLTRVRLAFPDLFVAKDYQDNKRFRYSATLLVEPGSANDKAIQAAIAAEAKAFYKDKAKQIEAWRGIPQKFCYTSGDLKDYDGFKGMMALALHRYAEQGRPGVFDKNLAPLTEADGKPYAGCYVNVRGEIWCQAGQNPGVRGSLISLQFAGDGDAFTAGTKPSPDDFTALEEGTEESPLE